MAMFRSALVLPHPSTNLLAAIAFPKPNAFSSKPRAALQKLKSSSGDRWSTKSAVIADSLRALEWDRVCELVSSFAGTQLGREAAKAQLWSTTGLSFEESRMRLRETSAAIELINYGVGGMDFSGIDVVSVKSAIRQASKHFPITGLEAIAIVSLIEFAENLQSTVEDAAEDADCYSRFMPLGEVIMNASICHSLVKAVQQIIDEDGSVKDSASSELKRFRDQVRLLERKVYQLMDKLARNNRSESSSLEVCNIDGRWCIKSMPTRPVNFDGLLLSSGTDSGNLIEPIVAIPLNDDLQQARALVVKAEDDVLSQLTDKMLVELGSIQDLLDIMIQLDAVAARAKYCIEYGATYPNIFLPGDSSRSFTLEGDSQLNGTSNKASFSHPQREWKLYMPKACHPLLLKQHRENLKDARHALANAASDPRRKKMQGKSMPADDIDSHLDQMKQNVLQMERCPPVPVDFIISTKTTVVVVTGPNTGGKTVSLKTIGLASLMSKAGLYVLASEPVKVPWFDAVYAAIGDEQSLTQSLSTFSGHLKQISAIRSNSTSKSLVLLDEVGAGTNPLEGAALGMSLLESFAESGCFLTIATTHHGELKALKYSNHVFENACVEFDEESLKPTYRLLWGIPGRSNAINTAEKLGLPLAILSKAQKLHGKSSAEINEIIIGMESSKQDFVQHLQGAQHHLELSRKLHHDLMMSRQRVAKHSGMLIKRKAKAVSDIASMARSALRVKLQQHLESLATTSTFQYIAADSNEGQKQNHQVMASTNRSGQQDNSSSISKPAHEKPLRIPEVGQKVLVPSLGKEAVVLEVLASKGQILVQANNLKLRLRLTDLATGVRNN